MIEAEPIEVGTNSREGERKEDKQPSLVERMYGSKPDFLGSNLVCYRLLYELNKALNFSVPQFTQWCMPPWVVLNEFK